MVEYCIRVHVINTIYRFDLSRKSIRLLNVSGTWLYDIKICYKFSSVIWYYSPPPPSKIVFYFRIFLPERTLRKMDTNSVIVLRCSVWFKKKNIYKCSKYYYLFIIEEIVLCFVIEIIATKNEIYPYNSNNNNNNSYVVIIILNNVHITTYMFPWIRNKSRICFKGL